MAPIGLPIVQRRSPTKFVVSMTSVSPSQWPRDSPDQWRMSALNAGRPSSGTTRTVCTISVISTTWSGVWNTWTFWL